jgi:1-acyl-sn-glycerol-3-phosphate acyltransferase
MSAAFLFDSQTHVCLAYTNNPFQHAEVVTARRRTTMTTGKFLPKASSSSHSALKAVYASPDAMDLINAKVENFRPGPELSIGSLKLNWYGAIWGVVGVSLGFLWWLGLAMCQVFQFLTRQKFDPQWRLPVEVGHLWGTAVLKLTNCYPVVSGKNNLEAIYRRSKDTNTRKPVMFVANHSSWMDIYFVGVSIGWQNYKMVAKKELLKVPFLSKSLKVAKHILLDRDDLKSQLKTYKTGVKYLKNGVNLVTFAEGTRSANGRLGPFKKGAFRMATSVGASIVPISIGYAHKVHPKDYVLPVRMGRRIPASLHIGEPIETEGKSEEELMEAVWEKIAEKLPESQKPLVGTPQIVS